MDCGFKKIKNFISEDSLSRLEKILSKIQTTWCLNNKELYESKAINMAYLTKEGSLDDDDRLFLLQFIGSKQIQKELSLIFDSSVYFLNTQLFFNPFNINQKNYWHRDIQYSSKNENEQKEILERNKLMVVHFRFAIKDEEGIELIPGSNKRWDNEEEYDVRLEKNNRNSYDEIRSSKAQKVSLNRGELLIFDANIIHRGLYGKDRMALDLLFCVDDPTILKYSNSSCYPKNEEMKYIDNYKIFKKN